MGIWLVGTTNQLFKRGSETERKLKKKKKVVNDETRFFVMGPFCTHHSICLNTGF